MSSKPMALVVPLLLVALTTVVPPSLAITPKVLEKVVEDGRTLTVPSPRAVGNVSSACRNALDIILFGQGEGWSTLRTYVLDAFGKPEAGILQYNFRWLGHFDECRSIKVPVAPFNGEPFRYCAVFFNVNGSAIFKVAVPPAVLTWGVCVPDECTEDDVQHELNYLFNATNFPVEPIGQESAVSCAPKYHPPYSAGFIGTVLLLAIIFSLMLLGAAYDVFLKYHQRKSKNLVVYTNDASIQKVPNGGGASDGLLDDAAPETQDDRAQLVLQPEPPKLALWQQFLLAFAFNRNLTKLMSTSAGGDRGIACLNGLRVLSMAWVILGHSFFFPMTTSMVANLPIALDWYQSFGFQVIINAFFSVDSFFFLSGLLLTYITLKKMAKKEGRIPWGWFYFHRYWRLTPAILVTTLIWMYIKPYVGEGPVYKSFQNVDTCINYWWTNILYINNFYPRSFANECIGWVWYLANDMQFFIISPLILIPLYRKPWVGLTMIGALLASSFGVTGALVGIFKFGPNQTPIQGYPPATADYSSVIYSKPYCRIPPYLVGMLQGYLMYRQGDRKIKLHPLLVTLGWAAATAIGMACVYGLYGGHHGHLTLGGSIVYEMFSRFAWGIALAWLVFACKEGYGGWVNDLLSWSAWLPLSRVTYSAYLLHPIVIFVFLGNLKVAVMATLWTQPVYYIGYLVLSYAAAVLMALFIEFPFGNLEKMFGLTI